MYIPRLYSRVKILENNSYCTVREAHISYHNVSDIMYVANDSVPDRGVLPKVQ